jgi:hypothetical protein
VTEISHDAAVIAKPRKRGRRKFVIIGGGILAIVFLIACLYGFLKFYGRYQLAAAIAEADRSDPNWRIEDIEANRAVCPDDENSILVVEAAATLLPKPWPVWPAPEAGDDAQYRVRVQEALASGLENARVGERLDDRMMEALRAELTRASPAVEKARTLAKLPNGRKMLTWSPDLMGTLTPHFQDMRDVVLLLSYHSMLLAQEKKMNEAFEACRAAMNASRSVGDEPMAISQLVRVACRNAAAHSMERVLGLGDVSENTLSETQRALEQESEQNLFLYVARAERAILNGFLERLETGKLPMTTVQGMVGSRLNSGTLPSMDDMEMLFLANAPETQHAPMLRFLTRIVEASKLPPGERRPMLRVLEAEAPNEPLLVRLLMPAFGKMELGCVRSTAELRCATVMLALERYRQATGKWPDSLHSLAPRWIAKVPVDPFDGKPVRYRRFEQGVIVYSVGMDEIDNGGELEKPDGSQGADLGFRLFDPRHRRRTARKFELPKPAVQEN